MTKEKLEIEKEDGVISWKYSNLEKYFEEPYKTICNNFDCIVHYNPKEGWLIVQKLRYGLQGDKSLPEIITSGDTLFIKDISKLENYFYMKSLLDKAIYDLLKKDLSEHFGHHVDNTMNGNEKGGKGMTEVTLTFATQAQADNAVMALSNGYRVEQFYMAVNSTMKPYVVRVYVPSDDVAQISG